MANEGHILIPNKSGKSGREITVQDLYGPLDKGSAKPSFCYPKRKANLTEELEKMQSSLANGYIGQDRVMEFKMKIREKKERLDAINEQEAVTRKLFEDNKDIFMKRRLELAEEISMSMPTEKDVQKRRVNPWRTLQKEKSGLEAKKREFIIISLLAGEESSIPFLQRESA